jgi:hypothetical protein
MGKGMAKRVPKVRSENGRGKGGELVSVNFIRVEIVLRKYPMHALQKDSTAKEIVVTDTDPDGNVLLRWRVLFTAPEGTPGPLAYRVDRLIIDRAIEEQMKGGEPPTFVRLGSLNEICIALGTAPTGPNMKAIKKALLQLQGTLIDMDGEVHSRFSRYGGVTFTGKKLPDGTRADAVYVSLSPEYREILKRAKTRPLDYDYLKELPPASSKFYEIISSRIFGALNSGSESPEARILYSEFCSLSALTRYSIQWEMVKQMKRIIEPHIVSGYVSQVSYEPRRDSTGNADWMMVFIPGPKSRREYEAATKKGVINSSAKVIEIAPAKPSTSTPPTPESTPKEPTQEPLNLPPDPPLTEAQELAQRLVKIGVSLVRAQAVVEMNPEGAREWLDAHAFGCLPDTVRDLGPYLAQVIAEKAPPPQKYRQHKEQEAARARAQKREEHAKHKDAAKKDWEAEERSAMHQYLENLSLEEAEAFDRAVLQGLDLSKRKVLDLLHGGGRAATLEGFRFDHWRKMKRETSS